MKRRYKLLGGLLGLGALGVLAAGLVLSHDGACGSAPALPAGVTTMQAIAYRCYGPPEVLALEATAKPVPAPDQLLVKVHTAAVNPLDWHYLRGKPYIMRMSSGISVPADSKLGVDFAGTVEAVGAKVTRFKPGDAVFGGADGAFAEYLVVRESRAVVPKPPQVSFEQAAAVPIAAVTALQALRDKGKLQPGQQVLINGASGGVGSYAVQIAKSMGATVTGVCSTRNLALVSGLGADQVIDYTQTNFTEGSQRFDLIIDTVGNHSLGAVRQALTPGGTLVMVGSIDTGAWIGPLWHPLTALVVGKFVSQKLEPLLAELNQADLQVLADLLASGALRSEIDRRYPLSAVAEAVAYLESGRARGKVIIEVSTPPTQVPDPATL